MARITRVKSAQQRYETVPVLDDAGNPVKVPLTKADGSPKMTKANGSRAARPVFITKTVADKSKPKPLLSCDFPGCQINGGQIAIGTPYMWVKPKSGPYGGRQRNRHAEHPAWKPWDLSSSMPVRLQQIASEAQDAIGGCTTEDEVTDALSNAAEEIRSLAEEKREAAGNIEEGFGHPTYQSEELEQIADDLDGWADEVETADVPALEDYPGTSDMIECEECSGDGETENPDWDADDAEAEGDDYAEPETIECAECSGTGQVDDPEPEPDMDAWMEAVQDAVSILDESPV